METYELLIHGDIHYITKFCILLTVHLITVFVNNQLHVQFFFLYLFIPFLYMFRAAKCSSSGESIVSIRPLVYVTVWYAGLDVTCIPHCHIHRLTYTRGRIDTVDSPGDEHLVARNVSRIGINKYRKTNCASSWLFTKIILLIRVLKICNNSNTLAYILNCIF